MKRKSVDERLEVTSYGNVEVGVGVCPQSIPDYPTDEQNWLGVLPGHRHEPRQGRLR
jgi:hypothetical protein